MIISIVGIGYVGLSLSVLISKHHEVIALDIDKNKVGLINKGISPFKDHDLELALKQNNLNLNATTDQKTAYEKARYVIVATPTNYDSKTGSFDTTSVENVIRDVIAINSEITIVIKSTIPIGFTDRMKKKFSKENIFFCPEFLRESTALYDNYYPSRIVIGSKSNDAIVFSEILSNCAKKKDISIIFMDSKEAEAVKLFANTFLAMRVAFFNELDSFGEVNNLNSRNIIDGIASDDRIGNFYNNPSFGYGGYCLPKDTQQLLQNFKDVPNEIITAVVKANSTRKKFIVESILRKNVKKVGIYRLIMKTDSDNFRDSAVLDIIEKLKNNGLKITVYEPLLKEDVFKEALVIKNLNQFIKDSDLIIANRISDELESVVDKVYSRDIFYNN